ncbi:unnamed protein product, partial [Rotaria sp. Silwood2]
KATKNGYICKIPYRKQSNLNEIFFCYKYSSNSSKCQTTNGLEDECQQGKYQLLLIENNQYRQFITPIINSTKYSICLTYYYYLTRKENLILSTYYLNEEDERIFIGTIDHTQTDFNRWNFAEQYFNSNSKSFQIIYEIYMNDMSNPSQPYYVAFDQITLTEPIYGDYFPIDKTEDDLRFLANERIFLSNDSNITHTTDGFLTTTSDEQLDKTTSLLFNHSTQQRETSSDTSTWTTFSSQPSTTAATNTNSNNVGTTIYNDNNYNDSTDNSATISSISTSTSTSTSTITTSTITNATIRDPSGYDLKTVLGLSIGLGIPAALGVIAWSIIIINKILNRKKTKVSPTKHKDKHRSKKSKDIPLKKQGHHHRHHHKKTNKTIENIV